MGFGIFDEHVLRTHEDVLGFGNTPGHLNFMQGGPLGTRLDILICTNNTAVDHVVWFSPTGFYDDYRLGSVTIPARAGYDGTPGVNVIAAIMPTDQPYILILPLIPLWAGCDDTLASGETISIVAMGGDF